MIENCKFEIWNYRYNQFCPCEILRLSKTGKNLFARIHGYSWKEDRDTGEKIALEEFTTTVYLSSLRNIGSKGLDVLSIFSSRSFIQSKGYRLIIDFSEFNSEGDIKVYYKYIERLNEGSKNTSEGWDWINSYGCQFKKLQSGYNFITICPEDEVEFCTFIPERIREHRKTWYFEDPLDAEAQEFLEKLLGYVREDGKTWMQYFREVTDGKHLGAKLRSDETMVCIDSTDPKKPFMIPDPKNPEQIFACSEVEEFIEVVSKYAEKK